MGGHDQGLEVCVRMLMWVNEWDKLHGIFEKKMEDGSTKKSVQASRVFCVCVLERARLCVPLCVCLL